MSRREDIENSIWSDPPFAALSANAKLVYLWSFTNSRCPMSGMYKVSERTISFETSMAAEDVSSAVTELREAAFLKVEGDLFWVRSRVKHLRVRSWQIARSIANDLGKLAADYGLISEFLVLYGQEEWLAPELQKLVFTGDLVNVGEPIDNVVDVTGLGLRPSSRTNDQGTAGITRERALVVRGLFDYWRERCDHPAARLTNERRRVVGARLAEGYTEKQIRSAIDGAKVGAFEKDGRRFDDLELICRNGSKLESFIDRPAPGVTVDLTAARRRAAFRDAMKGTA